MNTYRQRLIGLAAAGVLVLIAVGPPALLVATGALPNPSDFTLDRLTGPDDGSLAVAVLGVVAWCAWAVLLVCMVLDLAARLRGVRVRRVPGLALPQLTVGRLVALAALLFVSLPTPAPTLPRFTPPAGTPEPAPLPVSAPVAAPTPTHAPARPSTEPSPDVRPTQTYVVKRGDSLWRIAEKHLGDGRRYDEIVALNRAILNGEPDFLQPGTTLRLPAGSGTEDSAYVVQPGDTLSEIAQDTLGDADAYPRIADASDQTLQPDGERLLDPDLIKPGWQLTIPNDHPASEARPDRAATPTAPQRPRPAHENDDHRATPPPPPASPGTATPSESGAEDDEGAVVPAWLLPGLAGAGAVLAGSLLLVLRQHRRTQLRYRRPGRVVAPPPDELRAVEKSAHVTGSLISPRVDALDRALRCLATAEAPRVESLLLSHDRITLTLVEASVLAPPWTGADRSWSAPLAAGFPDVDGVEPPYPLLVSLGATANGLLLVNLEEIRCASIAGDASAAADLGRHIAAELSLNAWSTLVEIDTFGLGNDLGSIDPLRLHTHDADHSSALEQLTNELEAEATDVLPDRFRAVVASSFQHDPEGVRRLAKVIGNLEGRPAAAVVSIGGPPLVDDLRIEIDEDGQAAAIPHLGLTFTAAGLSTDEAAACSAIVDLTRDADDAPIPSDGAAPHEPIADQSGALRGDHTEPRTPEAPGERSLLPEASDTYVRKAATTADDVAALAPVVPAETEHLLAEADPHLDADVDRWFDTEGNVPRLILLGPVNARGTGDPKAITRRKPYYVELLAYLALHPHGVTSVQVGEAFSIRPDRARVDLAAIRRWLGTNPATGLQHLPSARSQQQRGAAGGAIYRLEGVLTDVDLFRRLRTRGQSRGAPGMEDLVTALRLVSGEPFTATRPAGWSWLLDDDRLDHIMICAIVDVAHIVTTHALASDDHELARFASDVARAAAPDDEVAQLDRIEIERAVGHLDLAERLSAERTLERTEDAWGPVDDPPRTRSVRRRDAESR
ncbi:LysM peptidoglycan-binding domain-containing protein [Nocardioides sp. BGMRC 2183]|nr:LysM peptidoglycan-binding domain-containing protein [Nocardioides sp. BGMRC 2183]